MPSLNAILADHPSLLLIDASSQVIHLGWLRRGQPATWQATEQEAGTGLYQLLDRADLSPNDVDAFAYCAGPGSMLGIRTIAAALRTWVALRPRPIFHYRSLDLLVRTAGQPGATLICDARRRSWHAITLDSVGRPQPLTRIPEGELPAGPLLMPAGFRTWTTLPDPPPLTVPYEPPLLASTWSDEDLFALTDDADAFQPDRPTYARWTPSVHQAPSA